MLYYVNLIMAVFPTKNLNYNKFSSEKQNFKEIANSKPFKIQYMFSPLKQGYVYKKNQPRFAIHHLPEVSGEEIEAII